MDEHANAAALDQGSKGDYMIRSLGQAPEFEILDGDSINCFIEFGDGDRIQAVGSCLLEALMSLCMIVGEEAQSIEDESALQGAG